VTTPYPTRPDPLNFYKIWTRPDLTSGWARLVSNTTGQIWQKFTCNCLKFQQRTWFLFWARFKWTINILQRKLDGRPATLVLSTFQATTDSFLTAARFISYSYTNDSIADIISLRKLWVTKFHFNLLKYQSATAPATTNFSQANISDTIHNIPTMYRNCIHWNVQKQQNKCNVVTRNEYR